MRAVRRARPALVVLDATRPFDRAGPDGTRLTADGTRLTADEPARATATPTNLHGESAEVVTTDRVLGALDDVLA